MNPLKEWGTIKFIIREETINSQLHDQQLTAGMLLPEGIYYTPLHLAMNEKDMERLQALYNRQVIPHLLDLYSIRKTPVIEPPHTHPIKEFNKLLPTVHAVTFKIPPEKYVKLVNLSEEDLPFVKLMYKYLNSTPYYHTPFQANHTGDYDQPLPERLFTLMKHFDPKTLRLLTITPGKNKKPLIIPTLLPKYQEVRKILTPKTYHEYNTLPPFISPDHITLLVKNIIKNMKLPNNRVASKYLSLSMWGVDLTFQLANKFASAVIQLNIPRGESFYTIPYKSVLLSKQQPVHPMKMLYENVVLLHYDQTREMLYFKHEGDLYEVPLSKKVVISDDTVIIPLKNQDLVLRLEENYYNELMTELLKTCC